VQDSVILALGSLSLKMSLNKLLGPMPRNVWLVYMTFQIFLHGYLLNGIEYHHCTGEHPFVRVFDDPGVANESLNVN
jgi:hypothetical protein